MGIQLLGIERQSWGTVGERGGELGTTGLVDLADRLSGLRNPATHLFAVAPLPGLQIDPTHRRLGVGLGGFKRIELGDGLTAAARRPHPLVFQSQSLDAVLNAGAA